MTDYKKKSTRFFDVTQDGIIMRNVSLKIK